MHVLQLAGIEHKKWNQHIGRGQYPKFAWRSVTHGKPLEGKYVCKHGTFWSQMYGAVDRIVVERDRDKYLPALENLLKDVSEHLPSAESKLDVLNFESVDVVLQGPKQARLSAQFLRKRFLDIKVRESSKFWVQYVKDEIAKGGGKLSGGFQVRNKHT